MAFKAKKSKAVESSTPASWSVAQFSSFYTQNRSELIAHANRIVKDKAKAEEITQEALVKFMLAAPELSSDDHALSYLHRTIENLCIDLFRAENRRPNLVALDDATAEVESTWQVSGDHSQAISSAEDAAIIRQALSLLSPAERAALVMWEVEGRSTAEIAKELGIKESAVRHTVSRARASLRKVLSELVIDEERGLTALDLLSTTYKKAAELAGKSSKIALTFILVLTAFLGLNSLTGNEPNTSLITTSSSQLSSNQDMSEKLTSVEPAAPVVKPAAPAISNSISAQDYADHMQLSLNQLETVTLMLQVLDQADGGPAPTE
jgi:RNA polymerase sigma factor (sigma-70 family)